MEVKEVKIQVPEGYEVDMENSTFECIKFKPKKLTYNDIAHSLFYKKNYFYSSYQGDIIKSSSACNDYDDSEDSLNCTSENQVKKLIAINKLMNVAKYLNGNWKPNWKNSKEFKYWIGVRECYNRELYIENSSSFAFTNIYFKSEELAKQAIEVLGEDTIKLALSTDW